MEDTTNRGFLLLKREEVKFYLKIVFLTGKKLLSFHSIFSRFSFIFDYFC